jgi:hypothetical protein
MWLGNTQTVNLRLFSCCGTNAIDVNPPFKDDFDKPQGAVQRVLGPKQTTSAGRCNVTAEDFGKLKRNETFLYAGGQAWGLTVRLPEAIAYDHQS